MALFLLNDKSIPFLWYWIRIQSYSTTAFHSLLWRIFAVYSDDFLLMSARRKVSRKWTRYLQQLLKLIKLFLAQQSSSSRCNCRNLLLRVFFEFSKLLQGPERLSSSEKQN